MQKQIYSPHKLRLQIGISALLFGGAILLLDSRMALPCIFSAAFHECGHILAARLLGVGLTEMKLDLFGARLSLSSSLLSYKDECILAAAGPLFSFLLVILLPDPHACTNSFLLSLRDASLFLGVLNLIPVRGFDGGRILSSGISALLSPYAADLTERFLTGIFLIFLWGISVYLLLLTGGGLTLFVFSAGLFVKVFLS